MAISDLFSVPADASAGEIRLLGLKSAAIGLAFFVPGLLFFFLAKDWAMNTFGTPMPGGHVAMPRSVLLVIGGPMTLGYALVILGLSKVLFGAASKSNSALASIGRILFGLVATFGIIVIAAIIMVASDHR